MKCSDFIFLALGI